MHEKWESEINRERIKNSANRLHAQHKTIARKAQGQYMLSTLWMHFQMTCKCKMGL